MTIDFDGPHWDTDLIGPNGKLTRLHKGAKKPDAPAAAPAPARVDSSTDEDAARMGSRRMGLAGTILGAKPAGATLGKKSILGGQGTNYGGEQ